MGLISWYGGLSTTAKVFLILGVLAGIAVGATYGALALIRSTNNISYSSTTMPVRTSTTAALVGAKRPIQYWTYYRNMNVGPSAVVIPNSVAGADGYVSTSNSDCASICGSISGCTVMTYDIGTQTCRVYYSASTSDLVSSTTRQTYFAPTN